MLTNLDILETVGQDLDEARAKLEEARLALQAALDAQSAEGSDIEPLRQAIARLERIAAEVERVEGVEVGETVAVRS
jgi:hypothetical protein